MQSIEIKSLLHVILGDITQQKTDAIVNAANTSLLGGGGVDGAIHRAAGPELLEACRKIGGCRSGEARITPGFSLPARYIIHTPGPRYRDGTHNESIILRNSYLNCLQLAKEYDLHSISFPAISTGVYGFPRQAACEIALTTTIDFIVAHKYLLEVYFVLFDEDNYSTYNRILNDMLKNNNIKNFTVPLQ